MEGENGVVAVILARQQGAQPGLFELFLKGGILGLQLLEEAVVALFDGHVAERHQVLPVGAETVVVVPLVLELFQALLNLLGVFHIVPEALSCTGGLQLFDLPFRSVQLQRAPQDLQLGLVGIQFLFILFKFQHIFNYFPVMIVNDRIRQPRNTPRKAVPFRGKGRALPLSQPLRPRSLWGNRLPPLLRGGETYRRDLSSASAQCRKLKSGAFNQSLRVLWNNW